MKLLSINVALPIDTEYDEKIVSTGIFKKPTIGSIYVSKYNLEGDQQADLSNHGGEHKAVYAYSHDHYKYWSKLLNRQDLSYGQFGENFTVSGLDESILNIGDELQVGNCLFAITQPRVPCFKLAIKFANKDLPKLFTQSALTGVYLKVLEQGYVESGQRVVVTKKGLHQLNVKKLFLAFFHKDITDATEILKIALKIPELSIEWQNKIEKKLQLLNKF